LGFCLGDNQGKEQMAERLKSGRTPKWLVKIITQFVTLDEIRESAERKEPSLINKLIHKGWEGFFQEEFDDGSVGQWVSKSHVPPPKGQTVVMYLSGGGFMLNNRNHLEFPFRVKTPVAVYGFKYQSPTRYPTALDQCTRAYLTLCDRGYKVILAGDSAGGNLAMAVCLKVQTMGDPRLVKPVALYLAAPVTKMDDSAYEDPSVAANEWWDANSQKMFKHAQEFYMKDQDISRAMEPLASPIYATPDQMSKLPPTFLSYSTDEMLKDSVEQLGEKMKAAGVAVTVAVTTNSLAPKNSFYCIPLPRESVQHLEEYYAEGDLAAAYWGDQVDPWLSSFVNSRDRNHEPVPVLNHGT
jgi:acetyl esterase/lipase